MEQKYTLNNFKLSSHIPALFSYLKNLENEKNCEKKNYFLTEFDSNQTGFEFLSNAGLIGMKTNCKKVACFMSIILRSLMEDYSDVRLDEYFSDLYLSDNEEDVSEYSVLEIFNMVKDNISVDLNSFGDDEKDQDVTPYFDNDRFMGRTKFSNIFDIERLNQFYNEK